MKNSLLFLVLFLISNNISSQSFLGAWEASSTSDEGEKIKNVVVFTDGFQSSTWYHAETGAFISTSGGSWSLNGKIITEIVEFDSKNNERVGSEISFKIYIDNDKMGIEGNKLEWSRIDNGSPGALQGAWLMSGRVREGKTQVRDTKRPRKTMKILSGTRFQWIAFNTETKMFMGTGGGTYTTRDGVYQENIEFFSKDNAKVGLSLNFNFEIENGEWQHTGFSSKGDPLHEIWSVRK